MSNCNCGHCDGSGMGHLGNTSMPSSFNSYNDFSPFQGMGQGTQPTTQDIINSIPTNQQTLTQPIEPTRSQMVNNPPQMGPNVGLYNPPDSGDIDPMRALNSIKHTNILDLPSSHKPVSQVTSQTKMEPVNNFSVSGIKNEVKSSLHDSYLLIMKNINLAFILIAAFAWNDAIKYYIARMIKLQKGTPYYYLYYALIVTLLAVLSTRVSHKFL